LPNVAVHDLVIQPEAKELVVGTHGRSIYKADISVLHNFNEYQHKATHLFKISNIRRSSRWGNSWSQWSPPTLPKLKFSIFSNAPKKATISVFSGAVKVTSFTTQLSKGFTFVNYDVSMSKKGRKAYLKANKKASITTAKNGLYYLPIGTYTVKIGHVKQSFKVK